MRTKHFSLSIILCLFVCFASAQIEDTLQTVTVQAPLRIQETGRHITILTAKDIQKTQASSIDELLQYIPSLEIQSRGGFGVQADISMRGSTFTQVLVLVDGMKLNDPLTGHFSGYIPVSMAEIQRIEILRGAAAAMYGADAVGGVINIITKVFNHQPQGISGNGHLYFGENQLVHTEAGFVSKKDKTTFGAGLSMHHSKGEFISSKALDSTTVLDEYYNHFNIQTVGASFAHEFNPNITFKYRSSFDFRDFGARYFYTTSTFDKSVEKVNNWWNHAQLVKSSSKNVTDLNIAYKYNTDEFIFSPDFPSTNMHTTQLLNVGLNHLFLFKPHLTLKTGVQFDRRSIESNDRGNHNDIHYGIYGTGFYQKDRLNITLSARGDYDDNYKFEFSPQVNVSYILPSIVLRGSVGRGIRAADYTERYVSNNLTNLTPGRNLGNPNLKAETSWSQELGVDIKANKHIHFITTVFSRISSNLIDFVVTNESEIGSISNTGSLEENADYLFSKNIEDVNTLGIEVASNIRYHLAEHISFQGHLGYTFLETSNKDDIVSIYISNHAKHLFNTDLNLRYKRFDFGLSGIYKIRNRTRTSGIDQTLKKQYSVWNIQASVNITDHLGFSARAMNIFNEDYQNILGAKMPGRWLYGGLKWNF